MRDFLIKISNRKFIEGQLQNHYNMIQFTRHSILLFVAILFSFSINAQTEKVDNSPTQFKNPGWWTFGINAGSSYQSSDVCKTFQGWGLGLTLAKNVYYKPNSMFAFDIRGRLLYANQIGRDHERSYGLMNNTALNGGEREFGGLSSLDYYDETNPDPEGSFVYANHRTDLFEVGIEGVLNFNRLKEKTNVILNLYGGLNLDWYKARTDQGFGTNSLYAYETINADGGRSTILNELDNMRDGDYETVGDGHKNSYGTLTWMPSAGVELGYQLTPRFSIVAGHKITWSRADIMDGQRWNDDNTATGDNDLYHYTNLGFRWVVSPHTSNLEPPIIEFTRPRPLPHTTTQQNINVLADVKNLSSGNDLKATLNGEPFYGFTFNPKSESFSTNFDLQEGRNELTLVATNLAGQDTETAVIIYTPKSTPSSPTQNPPVVKITNPSSPGMEVSSPKYDLTSSVRNVNNKSDVQFIFNGKKTNNFNYSSSKNEVTSTLDLVEGRNTIKIIGTNKDGRGEDETSIIYEKPPCPKPTVSINNISNPVPVSANLARSNVKATIKNVKSRGDIRMYINGDRTTDFTYVASKNELTATVELERGNNNIRITAKTECGSDEDKESVNYQTASTPTPTNPTTPTAPTPPSTSVKNPPVVEIVNPNNGYTTTQNSTNVKAVVRYVTSKNQIRVKINNALMNNFNFNQGTGIVSFSAALNNGTNTVKVIATNAHGVANDNIAIIKQTATNNPTPTPTPPAPTTPTPAPCNQPVVKIQNVNQLNTNANVINNEIVGLVKNVDSRTQIKLTVNGKQITNFTFSNNTDKLKAKVTLKNGNNTIKLSAQNNCGNDEDSENVTFIVSTPTPTTPTPPTPSTPKPIVKITKPGRGATTQVASAPIQANVLHVGGKSDIKFLLNGTQTTNFSYNANTDVLTANVNLVEGTNNIKIIGTNSAGSDSDSKSITYIKPTQKQPPVVNINKPGNGQKFISNSADLKATVLHVNSKSGVTVKVNGTKTTNFTFNNNLVSAKITLVKGKNTIQVIGNNSDGQDQKTVSVTYNNTVRPTPTKPQPVPAPIVTITKPIKAGTKVLKQLYTFTGTVLNVVGKEKVSVKLNGKNVPFTFNNTTKKVTCVTQLIKGKNTFSITGFNASGKDSKSTNIIYETRTAPKPTVSIELMSLPVPTFSNPNPSNCNVKAISTNVPSKSNITITSNGTEITNFTFDKVTGDIEADIELDPGNNVIKIEVENANGKASDTGEITR